MSEQDTQQALHSELAKEVCNVLADRYVSRFAEWGATPEQALQVMRNNPAKLAADINKLYEAAAKELGL